MNLEQVQNNKEEPVKTRDEEVSQEADNYINGLFSGASEAVFKNILNKISKGEDLQSEEKNIEFYWPGWGREDFVSLESKIREKIAKERESSKAAEISEVADTIAKGFETAEKENARKTIFEKLDNGESLDSEKRNIALYWTGWKEDDFKKLQEILPQKMEQQKAADEVRAREIDEQIKNEDSINNLRKKIKNL